MVGVRPATGEVLDPRRAKKLQNLVAAAVVGLLPDNVVVTNLGDGSGSEPDGGIYPEMFEDGYMKNKVTYEMQKKESILNVLRDIPGVRVEVSADFDDTYERRTQTVKPDPKPVAVRSTETIESTTQTKGPAGGQPGVTAQGPNRQGATPAPDQAVNKTDSRTEETENSVGADVSTSLAKGFELREVWATVAIPSSYLETLWKTQNPTATSPPTKQDLTPVKTEVQQTVENIVEPLLLLQAIKGENTYKHINVEFLPSLPAPTIELPSTMSKATAWAGRHWSTVAMLGVALFSLRVLRSVVRGGTTGDPASAALASPALTLQPDAGSAAPDNESEPEDDRPRLRFKKGKSLKDDLVQIVQDDPDAAADILRSWISKAG